MEPPAVPDPLPVAHRTGTGRAPARVAVGGRQGCEAIIGLNNRRIVLANRNNAIRNAKASEVRKVVKIAAQHFDELARLWESMLP